MVDGKWVVTDGAIEGLDLEAVMARHQQFAQQLVTG